MENLDGTIIATAAPRMAESFHVTSVDITAAMTAYLVTLAVGIPASGFLAGRFGTRTVFGSAIAIFTVASGLCAISATLPMLISMRVLQGIGGAMMVPVGRLAVLRGVEKGDLIKAIACLTWPALIAPVLAPVIGGLFTQYASWRWIFVVNLPLGVLAGLLATRIVPAARPAQRSTMDWVGFLVTGVSLAGLVIALQGISGSSIRWVNVAIAFTVGVVSGGFAVRHLRRDTHPLMDLRTLRVRTFRAATAGGSAYRAVITAIPVLLPLLFQDAFGWTPTHSGLVVIAVFVGNVVSKPFTTPIMRRFGFRAVLLGSLAGGVASLLGCALLAETTPLWVILGVLFLSGVFRSIGYSAYNTLQFADIDPPNLPSANTLGATSAQLATGLGVALGALALRVGEPLTGDTGSGAYTVAFVILAAAMLLCTLDVTRLPADAGDKIRR